MEKEYICLKEASKMLGLDARTVKKILINNGVSYVKLSNKILINRENLLNFLNSNTKIKSN